MPGGHHLLGWTDATARPQIDIAFQHSPSLLVNALGPPPEDIVDAAHDRGIKVAALASSPRHAQKHVDIGVDIVVAQGTEAGGHTGEISSVVLWPQVIEEISPTPVLAAGGIAHGSQIAGALAMGAQGVWTGSIWLTVAESDMTPLVIEKLLAADSTQTVRSRALSGKPARQLRTEWTDAWDRPDCPGYLPMPLQYMLVADVMARVEPRPEPRAHRHARRSGRRHDGPRPLVPRRHPSPRRGIRRSRRTPRRPQRLTGFPAIRWQGNRSYESVSLPSQRCSSAVVVRSTISRSDDSHVNTSGSQPTDASAVSRLLSAITAAAPVWNGKP